VKLFVRKEMKGCKKTKQIDEIDAQILTSLLRESRISFTELARICDISVTAVIRRYNRLKRAGIILKERMHLNPLSVGYEIIAEIGISTDLSDREKAAQMLWDKHVFRLTSSLGRYDIYGLVMARNLDELERLVERIDIKPIVSGLDILIFADLWENQWHPENIAVNSSDWENFVPSPRKARSGFEPVSLDKTDKRIAEMLMEDSRMAFKNIAETLKISTKNVIQKYHNLREKGILNLSTISLDISKLGYKAILDTYLRVENRGNLPEVEAQLLRIPNSTFCAKFVGGAYDLRIAFIVADFSDVFRLKQQISSLRKIRSAEYYLHEVPGAWLDDFVGDSWRRL
jgi:DNA-binding Lrp family transcriptional regulator